ncbi:SEL1-like repeat protein [Aquimarina algiphila]|uniref:T9SS type A sorting domain-containing protein n=1 Tax=Aquimarina algiphila TaxID=2047982 RepID=A0A554VRJ3_9FLAO|nr:SEL1-like repeat protein [Aquimarina algiphila]TSE11284.1 hypothetical protein FOF46_01250 [Aquimarina algiphila]
MNKSFVWGLLCIALTYAQTSFAQDCTEKVAVAKDYLPVLEFLTTEHKKDLKESIIQCANNGNEEAQYTIAVLNLSINPSEGQQKLSFTTIKQRAESGDTSAFGKLAMLYKKGIGTDVNLTESYKWFDRAAGDGDSFSTYALGYFQMKGLGEARQDYSGAQDWFQSGDEPMAELWFYVMRYFGYGISANKPQAINALNALNTPESNTLAHYLRNQYVEPSSLSSIEDFVIKNMDNPLYNNPTGTAYDTSTDLKNEYTGKLVEMDWKKQTPTRVINEFKLKILDRESYYPRYSITIGTTTKTGALKINSGSLQLENLTFPIEELYRTNPDRDFVTLKLGGIDLSYVKSTPTEPSEAKEVGRLHASIVEYDDEPAPPIFLFLDAVDKEPEVPTPPTPPAVAEITSVSPNPTRGRITVHYSKPEIADSYLVLDQGARELAVSKINTKTGDFQHSFDDLLFYPSGVYYVRLFINGRAVDTKQVVKQ